MVYIVERWEIIVVPVFSLLLTGLACVGSLHAQIEEDEIDFEVMATVTAKQDTTLWELAEEYYGDPTNWTIIRDMNRISKERIIPIGTVIYIPVIPIKRAAGVVEPKPNVEEKKPAMEEELSAEVKRLLKQLNRVREDFEDSKANSEKLSKELKDKESAVKELSEAKTARDKRIEELEEKFRQSERNVKQLESLRDQLKVKLAEAEVAEKPSAPYIARGAYAVIPYVIGVEDVLEVSVWQHPELDKVLAVRSDGKITFPPVGEIEALGLQPRELADIISVELKPYFVEPEAFVRVTGSKSQKVIVLGQVAEPGLFRPQSQIDLIELVSMAGGVTPAADLKRCLVLRPNREVIPVDLGALLFKGDLKNNLILQSSDTLIVPEAIENQIFVLGEVLKPGAFVVKQEEEVTLRKALALAGGPRKYNVLDELSVLRGDETIHISLKKLLVENDPSQDIKLQFGDTVFVPVMIPEKVIVVGEVENPGVYELRDGVTALEAVTLAGGYTDDAVLKNVLVVRTASEPQTITVNLEEVVRKGEIDEDIPLKSGDVLFVPESTASDVGYVIQKILGPLQVLLTAEQIIYFSTRLAEQD